MHKLVATALVSLVAHVGALVWFAGARGRADASASVADRAVVTTPAVMVAEPEVVEVVLFETLETIETTVTGGVAERASTASSRIRERAPMRPVPEESGTGAPVTTAPEPAGAPQVPTGTLRMRREGERPTLAERLAAEASGMDGGAPVVVPDLPGARIDYEIYKVQARLRDRRWVATADPGAVAAARLELAALRMQRERVELVEQKDGTYRAEKDAFIAHVGRDGKVRFEDKPNLRVDGLSGRFDITDWIMRERGEDPYGAAKRAMLERTREQRFEIGKRHRKAELGRSADYVRQHLERVWSATRDVAVRKEAVFELWDECAEDGDEELVAGGAAARALIVGWVNTKLRGASAFTEGELARLNARRTSKAVFAPYGDGG